ncbi:MAG: phosphotransferase [Ktedonobacteraceae bacterium]|nr:phosphotransferase [Ktedonobacteraceae bacterium]
MPHDNYGLIPHTREPRVLLLRNPGGWTLPQHQAEDVSEINTSMKAQLGCDTTVLYCAYDRYKDDEREEQHRIYALENHSPDCSLPTNACWVSKADLDALVLAVADHRAVLEQWLSQAEKGILPTHHVPWTSPGWFSSASAWIQEQAMSLGLTLTGPIEQVQVSLWSTVLRVPTTTKPVYFKASAPTFSYEPKLTWKLSQLVPAHILPVLRIDQERHWMLTWDAGIPLSELEDRRTNPAQWEVILRDYARMQLQLIGQQETLLAIGCPDRRLDLLPLLLEDALSETSLLLPGQERGLPELEYAQLQACLPQLRAWCLELKSHGIPESLHHDDLHGGNILVSTDRYLFFDWAECAVTHPFCSLVIVERVFRYLLKFPPETITYLRDCYLQEWIQFEDMEQLQAAYTIAQRLGKLCRALTWRRLLTHLSPDERWEYETSYPYWLRVFLGTEE